MQSEVSFESEREKLIPEAGSFAGADAADPEFFCEGGGAKGRGVNNHGLGVATQYSA